MAQMNWVYIDPAGRRHQVGLYHGDKTRHLLIHCDRSIVQVDFSVKESAMYSFFIEDELCEIYLEKDKYGAFGYSFEINKNVDTPLNQRRRSILRGERKLFAAGLGVMALFVVALLVFNKCQKDKKRYEAMAERSILGLLTPEQVEQLQQQGKDTYATFYLGTEGGKNMAHYTFYTQDSQLVSGKVLPPDQSGLLLPTGFQIGDRHRFKAQYLPGTPDVHRIKFYEPDSTTLQKYLYIAATTEHLLHPERSEKYNHCLVQVVAEQQHWTALGHIMRQNASKKDGKAYLRLIRSPDVERLVKQRCGM